MAAAACWQAAAQAAPSPLTRTQRRRRLRRQRQQGCLGQTRKAAPAAADTTTWLVLDLHCQLIGQFRQQLQISEQSADALLQEFATATLHADAPDFVPLTPSMTSASTQVRWWRVLHAPPVTINGFSWDGRRGGSQCYMLPVTFGGFSWQGRVPCHVLLVTLGGSSW